MSNERGLAGHRARVIALAIVIVHDHLLVEPIIDSKKDVHAYRPLGGGVEFGERAAEAVVRELREETGLAVEVQELLSVAENLFVYEGEPGHEIVFEYLVRFAPSDEPRDLAPIPVHESGQTTEGVWLPLAEVLGGMHTMYPDGLEARLAAWLNRVAAS